MDGFKICGAFDNRNVYSFTCNAQTIAFGLLEFISALVIVFTHAFNMI